MKGVDESKRRTGPPHVSQRVRGSAVMRCRISKVRWHWSHWYSYVGTILNATCGRCEVSRRRGLRLAGLVVSLWLAGCATSEVQRLQARANYERGLTHLQERQSALALAAFQEAIALDGTVPTYRNWLGLLYLELQRPDLALPEFRRATEVDDGYAEAHLNTGIALAEMGRWTDAVAAYRRALALPTLPVP